MDGIGFDDIKVLRNADAIEITAPEGICNVEVYSADGRLMKSSDTLGETYISIPAPDENLLIVRVHTASAIHSYKLAR